MEESYQGGRRRPRDEKEGEDKSEFLDFPWVKKCKERETITYGKVKQYQRDPTHDHVEARPIEKESDNYDCKGRYDPREWESRSK